MAVSRFAILVMLAALVLGGCRAPRQDHRFAVQAFDAYDFPAARAELRPAAFAAPHDNTILNLSRLGLASLADGDTDEAEIALGRAFDLLSTGGLNADRTVASVLVNEGVRIWKGEPFEQALIYHETAALYAVLGDWENTRAAAANSLFRLTDFGRDQTPEKLARRAAEDDDYLDHGYTAVDTNFALGFLMQAIGSDLSGAPGSDDLFDDAVKINPDLKSLVSRLREGDYDTLLIIDYGKGPAKVSYGPDQALVRFQPLEDPHGPMLVSINESSDTRHPPVCDVDQMAVDHRWNNLDDVRRAKSAIGEVLVTGGFAAVAIGGHNRSDEAQLAGLGAIIAGLLTKSGARADTRQLEFLPHQVFLVPLRLESPSDVSVQIDGDPASRLLLANVKPGSPGAPRAVYVRLLGHDGVERAWLTRASPRYGNDHSGVRLGDFPWILGGHDVSKPSADVLGAYQAGGHLRQFTLDDLLDLYRQEDIVIGPPETGAAGALEQRDARDTDEPDPLHILDGGSHLYTPQADSLGFKRLYFNRHKAYKPRSETVRSLREQMRVPENAPVMETPP